MKGLSAAFHEVQFQAEVRRAHPLSLKLTRLGGAQLLDGLVRALRCRRLTPAPLSRHRSQHEYASAPRPRLRATTLAACSGLKDALTAHVDVVAKRRLAGAVRHAPPRPARQREAQGPDQQGRRHPRRARPLGAVTSCSASRRRTATRSATRRPSTPPPGA